MAAHGCKGRPAPGLPRLQEGGTATCMHVAGGTAPVLPELDFVQAELTLVRAELMLVRAELEGSPRWPWAVESGRAACPSGIFNICIMPSASRARCLCANAMFARQTPHPSHALAPGPN